MARSLCHYLAQSQVAAPQEECGLNLEEGEENELTPEGCQPHSEQLGEEFFLEEESEQGISMSAT